MYQGSYCYTVKQEQLCTKVPIFQFSLFLNYSYIVQIKEDLSYKFKTFFFLSYYTIIKLPVMHMP